MPGRKKKCPGCGKFIYVRTRPQDNARILVRDNQLLAVEEQWAIANGTHAQFVAAQQQKHAAASYLRLRLGREPSENEVKWVLLTEELAANAKEKQWGLYRNTRFEMAELLGKENKPVNALDYLLGVCYLDLNGPFNCGGLNDPELLRNYPPFNPSKGDLAPGIIARVQELMEGLELTPAEIESRFMEVAIGLAKSVSLPLPPGDAWNKLKPAIDET
jgi:hypothetical protein